MKKNVNVVKSNTPPNKEDVWVDNGNLKVFGNNGWEIMKNNHYYYEIDLHKGIFMLNENVIKWVINPGTTSDPFLRRWDYLYDELSIIEGLLLEGVNKDQIETAKKYILFFLESMMGTSLVKKILQIYDSLKEGQEAYLHIDSIDRDNCLALSSLYSYIARIDTNSVGWREEVQSNIDPLDKKLCRINDIVLNYKIQTYEDVEHLVCILEDELNGININIHCIEYILDYDSYILIKKRKHYFQKDNSDSTSVNHICTIIPQSRPAKIKYLDDSSPIATRKVLPEYKDLYKLWNDKFTYFNRENFLIEKDVWDSNNVSANQITEGYGVCKIDVPNYPSTSRNPQTFAVLCIPGAIYDNGYTDCIQLAWPMQIDETQSDGSKKLTPHQYFRIISTKTYTGAFSKVICDWIQMI